MKLPSPPVLLVSLIHARAQWQMKIHIYNQTKYTGAAEVIQYGALFSSQARSRENSHQ